METPASNQDRKMIFQSKTDMVITLTLNLLMLLYAMSLTMLGPLMPEIIVQYQLQLSQAGLISTFQSIGGVIFTILGGILADLAKKSGLIGITFSMYSISLLTIAFAPTYIAILALFFVLGASTRMLDVILNAYVSDINPHRRGFHINMLGISFSIGGLLGPLFASAFRNAGIKWYDTFLILGIICTLMSIIYFCIIKRIKRDEKVCHSSKSINLTKLLADPRILVLCLIMLIFSGYQSGISIWMPMYMEKALHAKPFLSGMAVSLFFIGVILGRILYSILLKEHQAKHIILLGTFLGAIVLISGIMVGNPFIMAGISGVAGFLTCAVIPLVITFACNYYPQSSGAASSIIILCSVISWMVFPWLIGVIADNTSFQWGMLIPGFSLILTFLLALTLPAPKDSI